MIFRMASHTMGGAFHSVELQAAILAFSKIIRCTDFVNPSPKIFELLFQIELDLKVKSLRLFSLLLFLFAFAFSLLLGRGSSLVLLLLPLLPFRSGVILFNC
jgi:hypothetical protein